MDDDTTINRLYARLRGQYAGEDRRAERRAHHTDWLKELLPYALGAAVIYGQFSVMQEKVGRLEKSVEAQWQRIGKLMERP
jgi:hypothetical protein